MSENLRYRDDLYARPSEPKIFISSEMRSKRLSKERVAAAEAAESTGRFRAWYWERDAVAGPYSSEAICIGQARTCDGLILIIAERVTEIVKDEFQAAHDAGAPCFVFLKSDTNAEDDAKHFIRSIRDRAHVTVYFDGIDDLRGKVTAALTHHMTWSWREGLLDNRLRRSSAPADLMLHIHRESFGFGPSRSYEQVPIIVDHDTNASVPLSEMIEKVESALAKGHYRGAIDLVLMLAGQVGAYGFSDTVIDLTDKVVHAVPYQALERNDRAWFLNLEGLALLHQGDRLRAITQFQHMERIGEELGDHGIVATALQNLAAIAHLNGDLDEAKDMSREALRQMMELDDFRGALQVAINRAALALDSSELDVADQILTDLKPILDNTSDDHLYSTYYGNRGLIAVKRKDFSSAQVEFSESLRYARHANDWLAVFNCQRSLGNVSLETGETFFALLWYRRALRTAEVLMTSPELQIAHASYAGALHAAGRPIDAERHFDLARSFAAKYGDREAWARHTMDVGSLAAMRGDAKAAEGLLTEALEEFRRLGNTEWQPLVLHNLIELYVAIGDVDQIISAAEQALQIMPIEAHTERSEFMGRAAHALLRLSRTDLASNYFDRAQLEIRNSGDRPKLAWESAAAAVALAQHGDLASASSFFAKSLEMFIELGDRTSEHKVRNDRAIAHTGSEQYEMARLDYDACLKIAVDLEDWELETQTCLNRGEMERRAGEPQRAVRWLRRAASLARQAGDKASEAEALGNLGITFTNMGSWDDAQAAFEHTLQIARDASHISAEATAIGGLATVKFNSGEYSTAAEHYKRASELNHSAGDPARRLEDLAGWMESCAVSGDVEEMVQAGQILVDDAQRIGNTRFAAKAFVRAAHRLVDREQLDDAIETFANAVIGEILAGTEEPSEVIGGTIFAIVDILNRKVPKQAEMMYGRIVVQIGRQQHLDQDTMDKLHSTFHAVRLRYEQFVDASAQPDTTVEGMEHA